MNEPLRRVLQVALPVLVLAAGVAAALALARSREEAASAVPPKAVPVVRTVTAEASAWQARVRTHGTVRPATRSDLVAEVGGRVLEVGAALAEGAFFEAGEVLVRLDARDHRVAVVDARATLAQAELGLELELAEAESARGEWEAMQRSEPPPPLVVRAPQVAEAKARVAAARARVESAERDVERCVVTAPYEGRVLEKDIDLGQFVARNARLARIYATDAAEVRLPVPDSELAFLDLDVTSAADGAFRDAAGPAVELRAEFGGREQVWHGRIVRTEGQLDARSRMINLIARVDAPYAGGDRSAPLLMNLFVEAAVLGPTFADVVVLPRAALRGSAQILVVDHQDRLRFRDVDLLRKERGSIIIRGGVEPGDRVCVTQLDAVVDGMTVRVDQGPANGEEPGR